MLALSSVSAWHLTPFSSLHSPRLPTPFPSCPHSILLMAPHSRRPTLLTLPGFRLKVEDLGVTLKAPNFARSVLPTRSDRVTVCRGSFLPRSSLTPWLTLPTPVAHSLLPTRGQEGVLAEERLRGVGFSILDASLDGHPMRRGDGQIIPTARRALYAAQLMSASRLMGTPLQPHPFSWPPPVPWVRPTFPRQVRPSFPQNIPASRLMDTPRLPPTEPTLLPFLPSSR